MIITITRQIMTPPPSKAPVRGLMNAFTELNSITHPLDFRTTSLPALFELDSLLRCHICKEFLVAPMLTSCGHTFCSVCIRKYLMHTAQCPMCSKEIRESNLNKNVLLEQVVLTYKDLRPVLLEQLSQEKNVSKSEHLRPLEQGPPRESPRESNRGASRTDSLEVIDLDDEDEQKPISNTNSVSDGDDIIIIEETRKRKQDVVMPSIDSIFKRQKPRTLAGAQEPRSSTVDKPSKKDLELGECPICFNKYPMEILQSAHIDLCLMNSESSHPAIQTPVSSSPQQTRPTFRKTTPSVDSFVPKEAKNEYKKMTKLDYSSLSTPALKSKLSKLELPVHGTRAQLETRYNEYLTIWNANCDSVQPKDPRLLRRQLIQWENTLKFKVNESGTKMEKEGWEDLIAKARASAKKTRETRDTDGEKTKLEETLN